MLHYVALPVVWGTATIAASALVLGKTRWIHDTNASFPSILLLLLLWPLAMPAILFELLRTIALQWLGVNPASVPNLDAQDAILGLSGTALAQMIRDGKLTSAELTARCIARVKKVNPLVNAVVCPRFKMAMEEAWWADEMLQANLVPAEHASLWGVPCLVKECFELPGLPFTAGIASRAGIVGKVTAPAIQRVLDAGMPVIGTTNVSEACMFHESNNTLYGLTRNPFDLARTAGGSSGGCGAGKPLPQISVLKVFFKKLLKSLHTFELLCKPFFLCGARMRSHSFISRSVTPFPCPSRNTPQPPPFPTNYKSRRCEQDGPRSSHVRRRRQHTDPCILQRLVRPQTYRRNSAQHGYDAEDLAGIRSLKVLPNRPYSTVGV